MAKEKLRERIFFLNVFIVLFHLGQFVDNIKNQFTDMQAYQRRVSCETYTRMQQWRYTQLPHSYLTKEKENRKKAQTIIRWIPTVLPTLKSQFSWTSVTELERKIC